MKIIAVEEHFTVEDINRLYTKVMPGENAMQKAYSKRNDKLASDGILTDFDKTRLEAMDRSGIDVQIIGYADNTPSQLLKDEGAAEQCRKANDYLYEGISRHPDRLYGYATLPVDDPVAAVDELSRCINELGFKGWMVNGPFRGDFMVSERFFPIFEKAVELDVPVYIHPGEVKGEIVDRYYSGSWNMMTAITFAGYGIGWHYDTGMHLMRLILSGIFDKLPNLKIIVGHWGEMLPYFLDRMNSALRPDVTGLAHDMKYYFWNNVYTNPSGMFFKNDFDFCLKTLNPEHILWGQDYPFVPNAENAASFLEEYDLDEETKEKIAHGNAEKLFKI